MMFIRYIFETYPDAVIIQTHRQPVEAIGLWCEMVTKMQSTLSDSVDKNEIGRSQLQAMKEMVESVQSFRDSRPDLADRFIDVKYLFNFDYKFY